MPVCAQMATLAPGAQPTMIDIAVRCAMVDLRVGGMRTRAHLGGVAVASFPGVEHIAIENLTPGGIFAVDWEDAFFYGEHGYLGPMHVRLRPKHMLPGVSTNGTVRSLAPAVDSPAAIPDRRFFPAVNRNEFYWRIGLPRFGLVLDSSEPLVNEATIQTVPPFEEAYRLVAPVVFRANLPRSAMLTRSVAPPITVESCSVKLQELRDLNATVVLASQTDHEATFDLMFRNESTEDNVLVSWVIWPRPEEVGHQAEGTIRLGRTPASVALKLPRDIFFRERYLAASVAEPFETKGAVVALFPALP